MTLLQAGIIIFSRGSSVSFLLLLYLCISFIYRKWLSPGGTKVLNKFNKKRPCCLSGKVYIQVECNIMSHSLSCVRLDILLFMLSKWVWFAAKQSKRKEKGVFHRVYQSTFAFYLFSILCCFLIHFEFLVFQYQGRTPRLNSRRRFVM